MPVTSESQRRAMEAAAHGKSTLGIPKSVGQEFLDASAPMKGKKLPWKAGQSKKKAPQSKGGPGPNADDVVADALGAMGGPGQETSADYRGEKDGKRV